MNSSTQDTMQIKPAMSQAWKYALIACSVTLIIVFIAFWSTYVAIVEIWWRSETFAHGFIIIPIVGFLIWRKREALSQITPQPAPVALVFVFGAALLWLLAYAADMAVAQHLAVVALIPTLIWLCIGNHAASLITFPLLYLFFAAPFGDFLVEPLQDLTAVFSVWALQVTGIPVYLEGRYLYIPSGNFEVAQACSGIRYLIASLALGTLYAYLTYRSYWRRFIFIVLSAIVPLIANGIRAYGIIMLAHLSDYSMAVGVDHLIYGWLFFGVVIFALIWIGSYFRDDTEDDEQKPVEQNSEAEIPAMKQFATWCAVAIVIATASPAFAGWVDAQQNRIAQKSIELPAGVNDWLGPNTFTTDWDPEFVGAVEVKGQYQKGEKAIDIYLAYYPTQSQGAELVSWHNKVFNNKVTKRLAGGSDLVALEPMGQQWPVLEMQIGSPQGQRLIWYWYEVNGNSTTSRLKAKLYEMLRRLSASEKGAAALVLSTTYEITPDEAKVALSQFLNDMLPSLRKVTSR